MVRCKFTSLRVENSALRMTMLIRRILMSIAERARGDGGGRTGCKSKRRKGSHLGTLDFTTFNRVR
eukprot:scaffold1969_cov206-Pinguiococcus_pyrenoidosus.AAC.5